ncbi:MAG: putative zinc-binding metallopeptidase [Vicinamibacteria bacterium]
MPPTVPPTWPDLTDEELLSVRMSDLPLRLEGTVVESRIAQLRAELDARGLKFPIHFYLAAEWFTPDGVPGIAVPFYLGHPRLMRLERAQMLEVEGGTYDDCLRILRHECGHALQHAYRLQLRSGWRRHFGSPTRKYPDEYRPNPASRRFVQHLRLYYAQSHPVEDFAETFAVWLQPRAVWRKRYAGWPALRKLEYVDELMAEIADLTPPVRTRRQVESLRTLSITLGEYYEQKRQEYSLEHPDIFDRDLQRLFSDDPAHRAHERASAFLRRNRADIRRVVSRWTGEYQFAVDQVLTDMIGRCRDLKLRAVGAERRLRMDAALMLTVNTMNFLHRRRWVAL